MSTIFCLQYQGLVDLELSFLISFESLFVALQVDVKRSMDDGEKGFNQLSIEERHLAYFLWVFCCRKD
jgi:hypothetical protein